MSRKTSNQSSTETPSQSRELSASSETTFVPKKGETHLVHYIMENKRYDACTGKKISKPITGATQPNHFDMCAPEWRKTGYEVVVLYDPRKVSGQKQVQQKTQEETVDLAGENTSAPIAGEKEN